MTGFLVENLISSYLPTCYLGFYVLWKGQLFLKVALPRKLAPVLRGNSGEKVGSKNESKPSLETSLHGVMRSKPSSFAGEKLREW